MTRVEILAVGNEVLAGDVRDTDSQTLARAVADLGGAVARITVVPDDVDAIAGAVREALARGTTLLLTVGGLGPTPDDATLAGVSLATGCPLRLDEGARDFVARRYATLAREGKVPSGALSAPREKLARLPDGARWLPNEVGTAPAPVLRAGDAVIASLPAPPAELESLVRGALQPVLRDALGAAAVARTSYRLAVAEETPFAPIHDRMQPRHPHVYLKSRFHGFAAGGELLVTLAARGPDEREARQRLDAAASDLEDALREARIAFRRSTDQPLSAETRLLDVEIRYPILVRADPERVYDAFATSAGLDGWFTSGATVDARPGGEIVYRWKDWGPHRVTTEARGKVHEARRPERFVFEWDSGDERPTIVELDFERVPEGTVVRLRERGFTDTPRGSARIVMEASGWGEALALAKLWVEHGLRY